MTSAKDIMQRALDAAKDHIPSEKITHTEMMENLAHAAGREMVLWPDQCHSQAEVGDFERAKMSTAYLGLTNPEATIPDVEQIKASLMLGRRLKDAT